MAGYLIERRKWPIINASPQGQCADGRQHSQSQGLEIGSFQGDPLTWKSLQGEKVRNEDNVLNKFRIWKESHVQMRKPYQSPGSDEKLILHNCPGRGSNSRPPAYRSFKHGQGVPPSHALNHSATAAVYKYVAIEF